jgi:drug/metabolite transporter (DMT)-like permease
MSHFFIFLCVLIWGTTTFLNKLSVEKMSPILMQVVVAVCYLFYIPIAFKITDASTKFSIHSVIYTTVASVLAIVGNVIFYMFLRGNPNTGASTMLLSLYPVVTLILSVIFLQEKLNLFQITGIILMIIGAVFLSIKK